MSKNRWKRQRLLFGLAASLARSDRGTLLTGAASAILLITCQMSMPWLLGVLIDRGILARSGRALSAACLALALTTSGVAVFGALQRQTFKRLATLSLVQLRVRLAEHMRRLPLSYFYGERIGRIASLFSNEAPTFCMVFDAVAGEFIVDGIRIAGLLVFLGYIYHWKALLCLASVPLYLLSSLPFNRKIMKQVGDLQTATSAMHAELHESIGATREIKAFGYERIDLKGLKQAFHAISVPRLKLNLYQESSTLTFLSFWLTAALLYWWGGRAVIMGQMTLGTLTALVSYLAMMQDPFARILGTSGEFHAAAEAGRALTDFFEIAPEPDRKETCLSRGERIVEGVRFHNVVFSYGDRPPVLRDINFELKAGEKLAIVGPSGAGKSTLVNLIPRFFEVTAGAIYFGSEPIRSIAMETLRGNIGVVFQDPFLMSGTVYENLLLGNPEATLDSVIKAALAANAHSFISLLPQGYDTEIGERGVMLSAGQKQRLAIARAVLRDPSLLILDEATASLDAESEAAVLDALARLQKGRTTIMIAHQFSSIIDADLVMLLREGRIQALGSHSDLMKHSEEYRRLFATYIATAAGAPAVSASAKTNGQRGDARLIVEGRS